MTGGGKNAKRAAKRAASQAQILKTAIHFRLEGLWDGVLQALASALAPTNPLLTSLPTPCLLRIFCVYLNQAQVVKCTRVCRILADWAWHCPELWGGELDVYGEIDDCTVGGGAAGTPSKAKNTSENTNSTGGIYGGAGGGAIQEGGSGGGDYMELSVNRRPLTDVAVQGLLGRLDPLTVLPTLRRVVLTSSLVTNETVLLVVRKCLNMEHLWVDDCKHVHLISLSALLVDFLTRTSGGGGDRDRKVLSKLEYFSVTSCGGSDGDSAGSTISSGFKKTSNVSTTAPSSSVSRKKGDKNAGSSLAMNQKNTYNAAMALENALVSCSMHPDIRIDIIHCQRCKRYASGYKCERCSISELYVLSREAHDMHMSAVGVNNVGGAAGMDEHPSLAALGYPVSCENNVPDHLCSYCFEEMNELMRRQQQLKKSTRPPGFRSGGAVPSPFTAAVAAAATTPTPTTTTSHQTPKTTTTNGESQYLSAKARAYAIANCAGLPMPPYGEDEEVPLAPVTLPLRSKDVPVSSSSSSSSLHQSFANKPVMSHPALVKSSMTTPVGLTATRRKKGPIKRDMLLQSASSHALSLSSSSSSS